MRFVDALRSRADYDRQRTPHALLLVPFANHAFDLTASPRTVLITRTVHRWLRAIFAAHAS